MKFNFFEIYLFMSYLNNFGPFIVDKLQSCFQLNIKNFISSVLFKLKKNH